VLVTEGYMDVVALTQLGFPQAVATLGTACTPIHVQKLLRQTDHVIFSFDGDSAGRRAARRALDASLPHANDDKIIKFLFLPTEHDPDSYVREYGAEAFEQQVRDAMPLSQFLVNEVAAGHDLTTSEGRAHMQFDAKPLLQAMPPSALRLQIVRSIAQMTQTTPAEIEALFELAQPVARAKVAPPKSRRTAPAGLERQIMRILVAHPALAREMDHSAISAVVEATPDQAEMLQQLIAAALALGENANFAALSENLRASGSDFDNIIAEIATEPESDVDVVRLELAGAIRQTKIKLIKVEIDRLAAAGLASDEARARYRELTQMQEQLRRQAAQENAAR
jgi:DNA primase